MNYKRITVKTLANIVVALCIILAISVFVNTLQNSAFEESSALGVRISELKSEIENQEAIIAEAEATILENEEKLPGLEKVEDATKKALKEANETLDTVCDRSSFSSFWCVDPTICEEFHSAVSKASSKYNDAYEDAKVCRKAISDANSAISQAEEYIAELNEDIEAYSKEKASLGWRIFFLLVAMALVFAGFVYLYKFLFNREDKKSGYIACGAMAGASFIYLCLPSNGLAFTYFLSLVIFALFYALIAEKVNVRIACRVVVIILSVIAFALTAPFAPFSMLCYAIAMILVSLILVPCVYTEYLDIAKHIFFTIITFGIWHLIWMYNTTENLNKVEKAEMRAPVRELLLCAFLPLYYIFWTYKTAENTELYGEEKDNHFNISVLCLALSVICPLLASIIIQDKTNIIVGKPVEAVAEPVAQPATEEPAPAAEEKAEVVTEA